MNDRGRCNFALGNILSRQCPEKATCQCVNCNREMCAQHSLPTTAGVLCVECATKKPQRALRPDIYSDEEMALFDRNYNLWSSSAGDMYDNLGLSEEQFDIS